MPASGSDYAPLIRTVGLSGLLVTFSPRMSDDANQAAIAYRAAVDSEEWPEISESSSTLVSAFFKIDLSVHSIADLTERLQGVLDRRNWFEAPLPSHRKLWTIPAVFGGPRAPQLVDAAEAAGVDPEAAAQELAASRTRVLTLGFAPGQPYLGTLSSTWNIPRLTTLNTPIPAGALVLAVRQFCLFTRMAPTGWRHVGQTAFRTFRLGTEDPIPLSPGDEVTFRSIETDELEAIEADNASGDGGATFEMLE